MIQFRFLSLLPPHTTPVSFQRLATAPEMMDSTNMAHAAEIRDGHREIPSWPGNRHVPFHYFWNRGQPKNGVIPLVPLKNRLRLAKPDLPRGPPNKLSQRRQETAKQARMA